MIPRSEHFGMLAEFDDVDALQAAARKTHAAGYRRVEAYSPLPVHGLAADLGFSRTRIPLVVLCGGIFGCIAGYLLQYWTTVIEYPMNIGGRPLHSWPAFLPVTFETTVLCASLSAVLGMLALNGLPRPHHPLFNIPQFARATQDRFFLFILAKDPLYHEESTRQFLTDLNPLEVIDVPRP